MPCAGIIRRDLTHSEAGRKKIILLGGKGGLVRSEEGVYLPDREVHTPFAQPLEEQRLRATARVMRIENEGASLRAKVPAIPFWRSLFAEHRAVWQAVFRETVWGILRREDQLLHDEVAITLEAGPRRNHAGRLDHDLLVDFQVGGLGALGQSGTLAASAA